MRIYREGRQHLLKHRQMQTKCRKQWEKEGEPIWTWQTPQCAQTFNAEKELTRRNLYYRHKQIQEQTQLETLKAHLLKKPDQGKQLQEGIPIETTENYQNNIKYNIGTENGNAKYAPRHMTDNQ